MPGILIMWLVCLTFLKDEAYSLARYAASYRATSSPLVLGKWIAVCALWLLTALVMLGVGLIPLIMGSGQAVVYPGQPSSLILVILMALATGSGVQEFYQQQREEDKNLL